MKQVRFLIEYFAVLIPYSLLRISPRWVVWAMATAIGRLIFALPVYRNVAIGNVRVAFPDLPAKESARMARRSFENLVINMCEFFWVAGRPKRIERCMAMSPGALQLTKDNAAEGKLMIFVNPHLGSWEASAILATHFCGIKMVAIAKMTRNPYLNDLLNKKSREIEGLKIIFSKGAMRETIKAMHQGYTVGTLIDQNTRVRDGGIFVDFFGLPVPCSKAPATLWRYCATNNIPASLIYAATVRENGKLVNYAEPISKPLEAYADDHEIIQELMRISEKYIQRYPEQYLWFYRRFQYIPEEVDSKTLKRYPAYAIVPDKKFFRKSKLNG